MLRMRSIIPRVQALHLDTALKDILQTHEHLDTPTLPVSVWLVAKGWGRLGSDTWPGQLLSAPLQSVLWIPQEA